ncbi:unnamed protein product, partial [Meganyctiphanes norvegica]
AFRTFSFLVTGTHAKFLFKKRVNYEHSIAWVAWLGMIGTASIIPTILVLKKELQHRGAGHMVWTAFKLIPLLALHYWLDIITPYGLLYSLYMVVASICLLKWSSLSPLNYDWDDWDMFDEKVFMFGNVMIAIFCILVNIIVIVMAIYRVGSIGNSVRSVWNDLNIYKKDTLGCANIENGKPNEKQNQHLYNILHLYSTVYRFLTK